MKRLGAGLLAAMLVSACGAPALAPMALTTTPAVQTESLFGWHGASGLKRALDTFSKEEGRKVTLDKNERMSRLVVALSPDDEDLLQHEMALGLSGPKVILEKNLPSGLYDRALRHLKLMRHQNLTPDFSWTVWTNKLVDNGRTIGYLMQSARGYQAFYSDKGKLLSVLVIPKTPAVPVPNANATPPEDSERV